MSVEQRSSSALFKRAEQLRRWEDSETNREPSVPKNKSRRIKFSSGCVFLAACAAGDKDEVLRLIQNGADINTANVDGLTALHQACIDDNLDMVEFLVEHGADVNRGDNEGWTPLHATASCGFQSIAKYLLENGADVAAVNNDGELPVDIAECDAMEELLQAEIDERGIDCDLARSEEERRMLQDAKEWVAGNDHESVNKSHHKTGATALHIAAAKGYVDVLKVLLQSGLVDVDSQDSDGWTPLHAAAYWDQKDMVKILVDNLADMDMKNYVGQTAFDIADLNMCRYLQDLKEKQPSLNRELINNRKLAKRRIDAKVEAPSKVKKVDNENEKDKEDENEDVEKKNRVNAAVSMADTNRISTPPLTQNNIPKAQTQPPNTSPRSVAENEDANALPSWRRPASFRSRLENESPAKNLTLRIGDKEQKSPTSPSRNNADSDVVLRRTHSFESDRTTPVQTSKESSSDSTNSSITSNVSTPVHTNAINTSPTKSPTSPTATSPQPTSQVRRSFVPPVRDEESETQRKAHAKRVRETRRSTQGVTLDEIKSAEQLVKRKNQPANSTPQVNSNSDQAPTVTTSNGDMSVTATITTGAPTVVSRSQEEVPSALQERRPSWRLRVDNNGSKFKLEDANTIAGAPTVFVRRGTGTGPTPMRPSSAPVEVGSPTAETTIVLPLRRSSKPVDDKEQDKENDVRNAQATQAVIQRRRRPKRRSTGVVHVDMDEIDPDKQDSNGSGDYDDNSIKLNHQDSGSEKNSRSSRLGSTGDATLVRNENGEIDYKRLWEQSQMDNERLKDKLRKSEEDLRETKQTLEKLTTVTSKNSLSELEKREKRAMERKLSEMEEELKQLEALKTENQRLKDENGALIRVISKLSK